MIAGPHGASDWLYLAGVPILAGAAAGELYCRNLGGPVLLDLGSSRREVQLGAGLLMLAIGCFDLFVAAPFMGFFYICFGGWALLFATRRVQIRQTGIFERKLFRWEEIEKYYLGPQGGLALKLKGKDWTRTRVRVPSELWRQANEVLASKLPAQQVQEPFAQFPDKDNI
jgi:hypothetical protein